MRRCPLGPPLEHARGRPRTGTPLMHVVVAVRRGHQVCWVHRVLLWDGGQEGRRGRGGSPDGVVGGTREHVRLEPLKVHVAEQRRRARGDTVPAAHCCHDALLPLLPLLLLHQVLQKQRLLLQQQGTLRSRP